MDPVLGEVGADLRDRRALRPQAEAVADDRAELRVDRAMPSSLRISPSGELVGDDPVRAAMLFGTPFIDRSRFRRQSSSARNTERRLAPLRGGPVAEHRSARDQQPARPVHPPDRLGALLDGAVGPVAVGEQIACASPRSTRRSRSRTRRRASAACPDTSRRRQVDEVEFRRSHSRRIRASCSGSDPSRSPRRRFLADSAMPMPRAAARLPVLRPS